MLYVVQRELNYIVNLSLAVLDNIIRMSSLCFRQIMNYRHNHLVWHSVLRKQSSIMINDIVNIYLTLLDHIVHMSSSNLCSRKILDYWIGGEKLRQHLTPDKGKRGRERERERE